MKNKLLLTTSLAGMLTTVGLSAVRNGAEVEGVREKNPYVTVRGGWLFGKTKYGIWGRDGGGVASSDVEKSIGNAWSGSAEFGYTLYDDRLLVGLELGYFTGKIKDVSLSLGGVATREGCGEIENFFEALNVGLRHDWGERAFLYGGIGAGVVRSRWFCNMTTTAAGVTIRGPLNGSEVRWRFLSQAFAGIGMDLNENWSLSVGYRLRYVHGKFHAEREVGALAFGDSMKQNIIHAAEIGLTYSF